MVARVIRTTRFGFRLRCLIFSVRNFLGGCRQVFGLSRFFAVGQFH